MKYEFVYTFVITKPTESKKINLYYLLDKRNIDAFFFKTDKYYRVVTVGATRRRVESLMNEIKGEHLRILDEFTFSILKDYITSREVGFSEYKI